MAGGTLVWDGERHQLVPSGHVPRVVLAGSVAGWSGTKACSQSGKAAIAALKGTETRVIEDPQIAEIYESRDGGLSVERPAERGLPPAWTGPSRGVAMAEPSLSGIAAFVLRQPSERPAAIRSADLLDVAGAIIAGLLPPGQAAEYCRQWCIVPRSFKPVDLPAPIAPLSPDLPGYLVGRFGLGQAKWRLMPADARAFDPGCMIFINTDETHPRAAIGAIISGDGKGCTALMARTEFGEGDIVYIRDGKACIPARLDRKL
jgi:sarcosine oxidase, subunit alpha